MIASIVGGFPLRPIPAPSVRPWAGLRLGDADANVGEMWLAGPDSLVETTRGEPVSLDALAAAAGAALVGEGGVRLLGPRFPLIVKLIDAAEWLSLQVHPSDELAAELYGTGALGKTEAWLVLDAEPGVDLITGPGPTLPEDELRAAIADGTLGRDRCEVRPAVSGDTLLVEAGTLHSIGAGAFVYEIEQPSDLTFRVSDWGRAAVPGRSLHPAESLRALRADAHAIPVGRGWQLDGGALDVREFRLEIADLPGPIERRPGGRSLEVVTVIEGEAQVTGHGWSERLARWETLVVPASTAGYRIEGNAAGRVCIGSVS
ncbi:MAG: class I mannose-6-phosphate isomerase [Chloroflexota bacterium]|nr:class I mannose-6-phosphate isomerase [Chloroflexota bacterium]